MSEGRDRQSQGTSRSLVPVGGYQLNWNNQNGSGWFGPLVPMNPVAPPDVKGRILDFPSGYNMVQRPRAYEPITFEQLRNFADGYDLLRIIIETRKDQMARLAWTVTVREQYKDKAESLQSKIDAIKEFMLRPDKENFWPEWLRLILEDLFVIDAPAIYRRLTYGGDLYALDPLDGGTIKRVIDDHGRTPEPPLPAFQQVLKGLPAVEYTSEELIYAPRNKRTHKLYGFSPVEQIIMTINVGMRRQIWQLQSFTEGNIPEALIGVPPNWTPDQIAKMQDWFDGMLEGNTAQRRKAKFVPGDIAKSFYSTKPDKLFDKETEEWLARVVCFAFSVSPQPFVQMINRATAETAQDQAVSDGLVPIMNWVKSLMDGVLIDDFGAPELEFTWEDEDELDPKTKSDILDAATASGRMTLNESRKEEGREPYDDPDADRPMFKGVAGYVPIFLTPEEKKAKEDAAAAIAGGGSPGGKPGDGTGGPPSAAQENSDADLSASQEVGTTDNKGAAGKSDVPFPGPTGGTVTKAAPRKTYLDPDRKAARRATTKAQDALATALAALGAKVARELKERLQLLGKAAPRHGPDIDIDELLRGLHIDFDADIKERLEEELSFEMAGVYADSGRLALSQMGSHVTGDLVDQVNDRSVEWARANAADLVSSIEDTTRDMLRASITSGMEENLSAEAIGGKLAEDYGFSEDRAALIAETEIAGANSMGALAGYEEAADMGLSVRKSWLILSDACDDCQANEDDGAIELDAQFSSGDDAPPAHPNCRCVLVPEVEDAEGNTIELDEIEGE